MTAYFDLVKRFERIAVINEVQSVLDWDAAAMMPSGGAAARGDQLAILAGLAHELLVADETRDALLAASDDPTLTPWETANLALMNHQHARATALPGDFVLAQTRANSRCEKVWREARHASDFRMVAPDLAEVVTFAREAAQALGAAVGLAPYDALMDGYQRGVRAADVEPLFERYVTFMDAALPLALQRQSDAGLAQPLSGPFPTVLQEGLCRSLASRAGLSFEHARLDRSAHPFCGGTPTDVRITTRYNEADPAVALMGVLHETGHALYERGLVVATSRQPAGMAAGMAVHESQALIIEMQACRSEQYLGWLGNQLLGTFGGEAGSFTGENLVRVWRKVEPSFIRVDADELTYPAHIVVRFRLERALIDGSLQVADLPGAWRDAMVSVLGIAPPDDARGCLQDIHWYFGGFGYFPSYTLGAMTAAQLMEAARRSDPDIDTALAMGDLIPLTRWLNAYVHALGSTLGLNDLLRAATGRPLDPACFEAHLTTRYLGGNPADFMQTSMRAHPEQVTR